MKSQVGRAVDFGLEPPSRLNTPPYTVPDVHKSTQVHKFTPPYSGSQRVGPAPVAPDPVLGATWYHQTWYRPGPFLHDAPRTPCQSSQAPVHPSGGGTWGAGQSSNRAAKRTRCKAWANSNKLSRQSRTDRQGSSVGSSDAPISILHFQLRFPKHAKNHA